MTFKNHDKSLLTRRLMQEAYCILKFCPIFLKPFKEVYNI